MVATILDGKEVAAEIREELKLEINKMPLQPGLGVLLVGDRADSATYVRMKEKACNQVGIVSYVSKFPSDVSQETLLEKINEYNSNESIHGILIQLPLPAHIDADTLLRAVEVRKDVDGLHPMNIAALCTSRPRHDLSRNQVDDGFNAPCTPKGCIELLDRYEVPIEGQNAVVLGRSNLVGLPIAMMLMQRNATVTICHSRTKNMQRHLELADIVIAAIGKPEFIKGEWLKPGVTIIDVGINSVDDSTSKRGYKLVGDVEFESSKAIAKAITPVPGGVGPLTVAMLLSNTVKAAQRSL